MNILVALFEKKDLKPLFKYLADYLINFDVDKEYAELRKENRENAEENGENGSEDEENTDEEDEECETGKYLNNFLVGVYRGC
ncbi:hypothetical protein HW132_34730 [Brasilonema sp. CT11]|nr:hypothetical protein [Brasilonema sp. CT11]